ncbi:MAG TPA: hypothetical protein VIT90_02790 [Lysobacter sp.]
MRLLTACVILFASSLCAPARAADAYVALEQRLSAEQMRATGLDTLAPAQLALLNQLLSENQNAVVEAAVAGRASDEVGLRNKHPAEPINANVAGTVRSLDIGNTVVLDNGQRWRIIEGSVYLGKPATNPRVTITPGFIGAWYLQIEGQSSKMKVQRID